MTFNKYVRVAIFGFIVITTAHVIQPKYGMRANFSFIVRYNNCLYAANYY